MSYGLLVGKTVVITGAATGIGRATAIGELMQEVSSRVRAHFTAAAKNGARLVLHHLGGPTATEMSEVEERVKEIGAKYVVVEGDISDNATSTKVS